MLTAVLLNREDVDYGWVIVGAHLVDIPCQSELFKQYREYLMRVQADQMGFVYKMGEDQSQFLKKLHDLSQYELEHGSIRTSDASSVNGDDEEVGYLDTDVIGLGATEGTNEPRVGGLGMVDGKENVGDTVHGEGHSTTGQVASAEKVPILMDESPLAVEHTVGGEHLSSGDCSTDIVCVSQS